MSPQIARFAALVTACSALWAAAPAQAREVLRVEGGRVVSTTDPFVPSGPGSDLGPEPRASQAPRATSGASISARRGPRAVRSSLRRALRRRAISRGAHRSYLRTYRRARSRHRRLRGARRRELGSVIATLDSIALHDGLSASRMPPLFLILRRNADFWPGSPFPSNRGIVTFRGSELVFEYYAGHGLQLQPLVNFKKANLMHGACVKRTGPCRKGALRKLLRELVRTSARRGGFRTWEYYFEFGGGRPPWISGMAQATALQAFARASQLLRERGWRRYAREGLRAYETAAPAGVAATGPFGGVHYLQYSFAPRLFIANAFLQAVIGLYDYSQITGDRTARRHFRRAEPQARRELLASDIGDWSTYSYRGNESSREYHELLREFAASLCDRLGKPEYCRTARRFRSYTTAPARLELLGPETVRKRRPARVRFSLSKLSAVQLTITRRGRTVFDRVVTFRRGDRYFAWTPRSAGVHRVRLAAKELRTGRGLRTRTSGEIESLAR